MTNEPSHARERRWPTYSKIKINSRRPVMRVFRQKDKMPGVTRMDSPRPTTFTIQRILVLTFWLAFGFASLLNGRHYLIFFLAASFALTVGLVSHALRADHPFADFSRAFLFSLLLYFVVVAVLGKSSWDPIENRWPGKWLTEPLYEVVVDRQWVDERTKKVLPDFDPRRDPSFVIGDFAIGRAVSPKEMPSRFDFMLSLHLILGISLAFAPGQYAFALAARLRRKGPGEQWYQPKSSRVSNLQ